MWRSTSVVVILMAAGCFGTSDPGRPEPGPQSVTPEPTPRPTDAAVAEPPKPARAVSFSTSVRPGGSSSVFVWELPPDIVSPALMRPDGENVYFEGAIIPPPGLLSWTLYVFDLAEKATPIGLLTSPTLTAVDGAGAVKELGPSGRPFYFHLEPSQITKGKLGLWLSGDGAAGPLGMVLRVLDHDPGFLYVSTSGLPEPPAADLADFLGRIGDAPRELAVRGESGAAGVELFLESDGYPESTRWSTSGFEVTRNGTSAVEVSTFDAALPSRQGWGDVMVGFLRVAGAEQWEAEATVQGQTDRVSYVTPFTASPAEWPFVRWSQEGEGETSLSATITGAAAPVVRRSVFSLWSSEGSIAQTFGVPFAPPEGSALYGQGIGQDGALRVFSGTRPVLVVPDAGRGIGAPVPVPDEATEARAADRPEEDHRPVRLHEATVNLHIAFDSYVEGSSTGSSNENCVTIDLTDSRLLGINAVATWASTGANPGRLALVAQSDPYNGFDAVYGASPLTIDYYGGEIPRALQVQVGVQSMDTRRETVSAAVVVEQDVTLTMKMEYKGSTPVLEEALSTCGVSWG